MRPSYSPRIPGHVSNDQWCLIDATASRPALYRRRETRVKVALTMGGHRLLDARNHALVRGRLETDLCEVERVGDGCSDGCGDT